MATNPAGEPSPIVVYGNLDEGTAVVVAESIAERVTATWGDSVVGTFGGFAAGLTIPAGYDEPVLMMTTDGVGT